MNREIKFRAWDPSIEEFNIRFTLNAGSVGAIEYLRPEHILMQYTGLKDKNGKEIYEGDVVNADGQVGEVIYLWHGFRVTGFYKPSFDDPSDAFSEALIEVIGNVHENPELLKA